MTDDDAIEAITAEDDVRAKLDALGIKYRKNATLAKLEQLLDAATADNTPEESDDVGLAAGIPLKEPVDPGVFEPRHRDPVTGEPVSPGYTTRNDKLRAATPDGWVIRSNGTLRVAWCPTCDHSIPLGEYANCPRCNTPAPQSV